MNGSWSREKIIAFLKACGAPDEEIEKLFVYENKRSLIIDHYGIRMQLFKMIEELNEAQREVIDMISGKKEASIGHMIEELADVALVTDQIIDYYGKRELFNRIYDFKLNRTLQRIK